MTFGNTAVKQLSDGNTQGTTLGTSATDLISFYNATPAAQPSAAGQAAIPQTGTSTGAGNLRHYNSTQSPGTGIATISCTEQSITVTGVVATDVAIVNKPTSQTGLSMVSGRVSAANTVQLSFANPTAGTLTPTDSEAYIVTTVPANLKLTATLSPTAVAASTTAEQTFTVTGLDTGMIVQVNKPTQQTGLAVCAARVSAKNTLAITFANLTASTITPTASESYSIAAFNGLVAASPIVRMGVNVGTLSAVVTNSSSEQVVTAAGILATDIPLGVSKPTTQAGLLVSSGRVSAANTLQVTIGNCSAASITPTASEVYDVTLYRASPTAPMNVVSASLTPTAVGANTTAEQTFTVSGLVSGNPVIVCPPSQATTKGISLTQSRISATNTLALTFMNVTAGSLTPAAGTYTIGQFNTTTPTAGNFTEVAVSPIQTLGVNLMNATRSALVTLGAMAGS